ncbi:MAG: Calcium-transporting ATPase 1 [Candidatus Heimdallarchaeota archaeon LC_3]|nr:MAG: Calcium-transporting ATPase 1 [Candidatus Heimdallarchaeota archaeon LC_3]
MNHNKSLDEIFEEFNSNTRGLTSEEAAVRIEKYGPNLISEGKKINPIKLLLAQFTDLLVILLIGAGIITAILGIIENDIGAIVDVTAIGIVVLLNALLGFYQEYSAEKAIAALIKFSKSEVTVIRNDSKMKIADSDIVPGDIIVLEAGNSIPADIRVIKAYEMKTNEGILTGESLPVRKKNTVLSKTTALADRMNMLFKGTTISTGSGTGIVVATAHNTELGKIAQSLQDIEPEETLLQKKLARLAKQITLAVVILAVIILIIGIFLGQEISNMLIFSIGLAVAAVPEGLPAVLTLSLAIAVNKMARKNSLIRKLPAVEVLGSATVICTDKTGTLTRNEMTVKQIWTNDHLYNVTGTGYQDNGDILNAKTSHLIDINTDRGLRYLLNVCLLCNDASIEVQADNLPFKIFGDPTEVSLLVLGSKIGWSFDNLSETWEKLFLFPFDSDRKLMSVIVKNKFQEEYLILVKGAPDVLIDICTTQYSQNEIIGLEESAKQSIRSISEGFSRNYAYRNLGIAIKKIDKETADKLILIEDNRSTEQDLTFIGVIGMIDPPRTSTGPAIARAARAGIKTIMITGDHKETAKAIGTDIGLITKKDPVPITGIELDQMSDNELENKLDSTCIFARVSPYHKLRIVNALKIKNNVVIMTGDGVNDAPALKRADVGIAMGITGTDVAKESSSMILVDDNFANIVEAVFEGRIVYDNMKKFIAFLLSANMGEVITVLLGLMLGLIFFNTVIIPLLAIQLLYINLVTDTFPALALGVDDPEADIMDRPPRNPKEPLLDKNLLSMIFTSGIVFAVMSLIAFFSAFDFGLNLSVLSHQELETALEKPITMVFAALIVYQLIHAINTSERGTVFTKKTLKNKWLMFSIVLGLILLLLAVEVKFFQEFLHTVDLNPIDWLIIAITSIPVLIVEEVRKKIMVR